MDISAGVTGLSLFSGIGGIDLGLRRAIAGYQTVGYVERQAYCQAVLLARMEESKLECAPIFGSIEEFDPVPFQDCTIVHGGFPCQDISNAGTRVGITGKRSGLWSEFARILGVCGRYAFIENVAALRTRGLDVVLGDLAERGFDQIEYDIFTAKEAGAPHERKRLFILARRISDSERDPLRIESKRGAGIPSASECGHAQPADMGEAVADCGSKRLERVVQTGSTSRTVGRSSGTEMDAELADSSDDHGRGGKRGTQARARSDPEWRRRSAGRNNQVGDSYWPPGPNDEDGWRRFLERGGAPPAQPGIRRGADGISSEMEFRTDRLMALGNAVCSQQAELAFRVLFTRLNE